MQIDENKLNIARVRAGLTLQECGAYPRVMQRIREGKPLQVRTVHKIANALGVDPAEIVKEVGSWRD